MPTLGTVSVPSDVESMEDDDDDESSLVTTTEEGVAAASELEIGMRRLGRLMELVLVSAGTTFLPASKMLLTELCRVTGLVVVEIDDALPNNVVDAVVGANAAFTAKRPA
jgi:hypothetical protein